MHHPPEQHHWASQPSHPDALHPAVGEEQSPAIYGAYIRAPRLHLPFSARLAYLLTTICGGTATWVALQRPPEPLLDSASPWTSAILGGWLALVGASYYGLTHVGGEVGIAISNEMVRFGRWPDQVVAIHRRDLVGATLSSRPWLGQEVEPALQQFLVRGFRYLTVRRKDGVLFHVALDSANMYAARIVRALTGQETLARPVPPPAQSPPVPSTRPDVHVQVSVDTVAATRRTGPPEPSVNTERLLWEAAVRRHDEILLAYLPYETDPHLLMQYPSITDVTVEPTAQFLDALGETATLRTDQFPASEATSQAYREHVKACSAAWARAERHAKRVGITQLDVGHQRKIRQAARLLRHAEGSDNVFEQATYLQQVAKLIEELTTEGAITPPPRITAELTARVTLALEKAQDAKT